MCFDQQANAIIAPAMFAALAAVLCMDLFHGVVTALALSIFSLLVSILSRKFLGKLADKLAGENVRLAGIVNRSGALVFIWRAEPGRWPVEYVSANAAAVLGYSAADFTSGRVEWPKITHPDDVPRLEKEIAGFLAKGQKTWSQEYRIVTKSGAVKWFRDNNVAIEDSGGNIVAVEAVIHDITARKDLEERLSRVNDCLLGLGPDFHENINRITALCGELFAGTCAMYNRLADNMLYTIGAWHTPPDFMPLDQPDGHICYDVIQGVPPEDLLVVPDLPTSRYAETDSNVRQYGLIAYMGHVVRCGQDKVGALCVVFQQPFSPTENDKKLFGILAAALSGEEARQATERTLRLKDVAVASCIDGIALADMAGNLTYVNDAFLKMWGYDHEREVLGKSAYMFWEDRAQARVVGEAIQQQGQWSGELNGKKKDGSIISVQLSGNLIRDSSGTALGTMASFLDITESKRMQQQILSLARFPSENPNPVLRIAKDGEILYSNNPGLELLANWNAKIGKKAPEKWQRLINEAWASATPGLQEEEEEEEEGDKILSFTISPVLEGGYANVYVRDITRRKRAEERLRLSEARYNAIFNGAAEGIIAADVQTKRLFHVNPTACRMFGYTADEFGRLGVADLHPREALAYVLSEFEAQARGENTLTQLPCLRKDGGLFYANISAVATVIDGRLCNVGMFSDTTALKQAEEQARSLANAIEIAHHGCLIASADYKISFANEYAGAKLGFNRDELCRQDLFSVCADREAVKEMIDAISVTGRWMGEIVLMRKDGGQLPGLMSVSALDGKGGVIALFQDITIQKEMRDKLMASEKLAVMGRLVADVSHELNNPMAIIIGGTQLLLSRLDEKSAALKIQLETILRNGQRCKTIIANLLGYGRTIDKKQEALNLPELVREAMDAVDYQYDMSGITLDLAFKHQEWSDTEITGNKSALLSVFVNLIRNARQAMGKEGRLAVTIWKPDKKHLRVAIQDTGIGLSQEQKATLFKPFVSGWKDMDGSGLGLATSRGIIELHGGQLSAESAGERKGSTFTVALPCKTKEKK